MSLEHRHDIDRPWKPEHDKQRVSRYMADCLAYRRPQLDALEADMEATIIAPLRMMHQRVNDFYKDMDKEAELIMEEFKDKAGIDPEDIEESRQALLALRCRWISIMPPLSSLEIQPPMPTSLPAPIESLPHPTEDPEWQEPPPSNTASDLNATAASLDGLPVYTLNDEADSDYHPDQERRTRKPRSGQPRKRQTHNESSPRGPQKKRKTQKNVSIRSPTHTLRAQSPLTPKSINVAPEAQMGIHETSNSASADEDWALQVALMRDSVGGKSNRQSNGESSSANIDEGSAAESGQRDFSRSVGNAKSIASSATDHTPTRKGKEPERPRMWQEPIARRGAPTTMQDGDDPEVDPFAESS
ncbi:hypothetical protein JX265_011676 [Neoarthrinium moseri]|uniref:Uncharacterized protein n=1 Tax=Neoarthrinium moseri TaxID=1658444 RepID=A0A9P9WBZ3_9PEZI|nr:hypothetical protein JX265_011676 [Neoarthrinium moseri]